MNLYTITKKRQVSIPKEVLEALNVAPNDKITYIIDENKNVRVINPKELIKSMKHSVEIPQKYQGMNTEAIIEEAKAEYFGKK